MAYQRARRSIEEPLRDPLNAPSVRGQHPHVVRADQDRTGANNVMYETRNAVGTFSPFPAITPTRAVSGVSSESSSSSGINATTALLILAVGGLAVYALSQAAKARAEARTRRNPDATQPPVGSVVVMQPALAALPTGAAPSGALVPTAVEPATSAPRVVEATDAVVVEKPKKRRRRTTQARDGSGRYLPAGTRARKVTEGAKECT